jgi:hypothetical protein
MRGMKMRRIRRIRKMRGMRRKRTATARLPIVVTVGCQTLIVVMTMMRRPEIIS